MTFHGVKTDETGLHAEDCDCVRCDAGYRPTPLERAAARRALALRRAEEARRALEAAKKVERPIRPRLEPPRPIVPPTPEQWDELRKLRKDLGK